ncbi:MAG: tetratricopeptide repeat protein [Calditrichaeota bacterium]|nr:tetratricopeptide repeat protein [Calditrichota bacterium]
MPAVNLSDMEPQIVTKINTLQDSLKIHPGNAAMWGKLGMTLYVHELMDGAAVCFENASELDPKDFRWAYFCGIARHNLGDAASQRWYERAVSINPDEPQLRVRLGNARLTEGDEAGAAKAFGQALGLDNRRADALLGLAQIDYLHQDYEQAAERLQKALAVQPDLREALALLISCYRMQWNQKAVMETSRRLQLLGEAPPPADPILNQMTGEGVSYHWVMETGGQLLDAGRTREAAGQFRRALAIRREGPAYSQLAIAQLRLGQPDSAVANFRRAYRLNPGSALNGFNLGMALSDHGDAGEGLSLLEQAYRKSPETPRYALILFDQYRKAGRWQAARDLAEKVYRAYPQNTEMGLRLSMLLATCKEARWRDGEKARAIAGEILARQNTPDPVALDCLGAALAECGRFEEALGAVGEAINRSVAGGQNDLANQLRLREASYQNKRPWRE